MSDQGKRKHPRKIAAWQAWVRFHSSAPYVKGHTRDVSRGGAYITVALSEAVEPGAPVDYILGVPMKEGDHWAIQTIDGEAQVVRAEDDGEGGVALKFVTERDI